MFTRLGDKNILFFFPVNVQEFLLFPLLIHDGSERVVNSLPYTSKLGLSWQHRFLSRAGSSEIVIFSCYLNTHVQFLLIGVLLLKFEL
jgi:hypothetical protein